VVTEMALAVVLLVGAGLLIRSFVRLIEVDPGFRPENVISFNLSMPAAKYQYDRQARNLAAQVSERMSSLPGVEAVGVTFGRPLDQNGMMRTTFNVEGRPPNPPEKRTPTQVHPSSPNYFRAMGIALKRGRLFTEAENRPDGPQVVVVSEEFAKKYFPNEDAIGKRIVLGITHDTAEVGKGTVTAGGEIVGIVADVKSQSLARPTYPATYIPYNTFPIQDIAVLLRTTSNLEALGPAIRVTLRDIDPDLPIFGLMTMKDAVSDSVSQPRFYMMLLAAFAGIALLLAALGIYGVISYTVSQRTRELGIRIALGATREKVVRQVIGQGVWLTLAGILLGVVAAGLLTSVIASLMFGVGKLDPMTFVAVPLVLTGVAVFASYLPARKASEVDPVIAMRAE
jgi:putative ABC transport system permease protein